MDTHASRTMPPSATPGTPLWSTSTNAARARGAGAAAAGAAAGAGAGRRRKTLSPSKALFFLASSFDDDDPAAAGAARRDDVENVPPVVPIKSLIKGNGAWAPSSSSSAAVAAIKPSSLAPQQPSSVAVGSTLFHSPVFVTWAKGGNREVGALWVSNSAAEEEAALSWVPKEPSPPGGLGARGDICNLAHALADAADLSAAVLGSQQQQQQHHHHHNHHHQSKAIDLARGRVLSASFVWLDTSTPGLSLVLSAPESEHVAGSGSGRGSGAILFLDFQGGKDAEPVARKALRMLQQGIGGGGGGSINSTMAPGRAEASEPVQKAAAVEAVNWGTADEATEMEEEEEEDLVVLVRRFLKTKPHSPGARAVARRMYRLTGYPLLSFGTIQAAARGDTDPAPLEPRTQPLAMCEMRAMVLSLEPILKGMNTTHQKGIKESEKRTGARAERRKDSGGCYRYTDLASNQEISPATYRARYMRGLEAAAAERNAALAAEEAAAAAEAARLLELRGEEEEGCVGETAPLGAEEVPAVETIEEADVEEAEVVVAGMEEEQEEEDELASIPMAGDEKEEEEKSVMVVAPDDAVPEASPLPIAADDGMAAVVEGQPEDTMLALAGPSLPMGGDEQVTEEGVDEKEDGGELSQEQDMFRGATAAEEQGRDVSEEDGEASMEGEADAAQQEPSSPSFTISTPATPAPATPSRDEERVEEVGEEDPGSLASILGDEGSSAACHSPSSSAVTASPVDVSAVLRTPYSCAPSTSGGQRSGISVISSGLRRLNLGLGDDDEAAEEEGQKQPASAAALDLDLVAAEEEEMAAAPFEPVIGPESELAPVVVVEAEAAVAAEAAAAAVDGPSVELELPALPALAPTQGLAPEELEALAAAAEAKLQEAIDAALRRYHHDLSAAHAAAVARLRCG